MHMGINGQRLDKSQMSARGYTLASKDFHIVMEIPVGSPDGYFKVGFKKKRNADYSGHLYVVLRWALNNFRATPQITSTTWATASSRCWNCCGRRTTTEPIPDTKCCSPSPLHWCPERHKPLTVSLVCSSCRSPTSVLKIKHRTLSVSGVKIENDNLLWCFRDCPRVEGVLGSSGDLPSGRGAEEHHIFHRDVLCGRVQQERL